MEVSISGENKEDLWEVLTEENQDTIFITYTTFLCVSSHLLKENKNAVLDSQ